ncbi:MAG: hypothetical protein QXI58_03205 [Candidatus Micrarchaeia archaeon]
MKKKGRREKEKRKVKEKKEKKEEKEEKREKKEEPKIRKTQGICIICQKEALGFPIKEDIVIRGIRKVKKTFGIAKGTTLVVCDEHVEEGFKKRERFEKNLLTYCGIGGIIGIILIIASILTGRDILGILSSIVLLIVLVGVMLLFSLAYYFPDVEGKEEIKKLIEEIKKEEKEEGGKEERK